MRGFPIEKERGHSISITSIDSESGYHLSITFTEAHRKTTIGLGQGFAIITRIGFLVIFYSQGMCRHQDKGEDG